MSEGFELAIELLMSPDKLQELCKKVYDIKNFVDFLVEEACEVMHDAYEAATNEGWETQQASRKPWADVPEANKATMRAAVTALLIHLGNKKGSIDAVTRERDRWHAEAKSQRVLLLEKLAETEQLHADLAAVSQQRDSRGSARTARNALSHILGMQFYVIEERSTGNVTTYQFDTRQQASLALHQILLMMHELRAVTILRATQEANAITVTFTWPLQIQRAEPESPEHQ